MQAEAGHASSISAGCPLIYYIIIVLTDEVPEVAVVSLCTKLGRPGKVFHVIGDVELAVVLEEVAE